MCLISIIIETAKCWNVHVNVSNAMLLICLSVTMVVCCYFLGVHEYVHLANKIV